MTDTDFPPVTAPQNTISPRDVRTILDRHRDKADIEWLQLPDSCVIIGLTFTDDVRLNDEAHCFRAGKTYQVRS